MNRVSVIHCADVHYDSGIRFLGTKERKRSEERRHSFEDILKMCRSEKIDYLLIAGDLFDVPEPEEQYVVRLKKEFERCEDTYIFIAPGNHDYVSAMSPYKWENFWPENVYIFLDGWECVEIEEDKVRVYGAAFTQPYQRKALLGIAEEDEYIQMGVLHGDISRISEYNPVTVEEIAESRLDYLALGHIHKRTDILKAGNTYYGYSGCHDGRGFDETGVQGIYKGDVWRGGCEMDFYPVSGRCLYRMKVDVTAKTEEEIAEDIMTHLPGTEKDIYEIVLEGETEETPHIEWIEEKIRVFYVKFVEKYNSLYDYETLMQEQGVRAEFVRKMMEMTDKGDIPVKSALRLGVEAFSGEVKYCED